MSQTLADLQAAIEQISTAVDADVAQDVKVLEAIEALIKKIEESGNTDFTAEVTALSKIAEKLSSDNDAVQAAIDKALPPPPPVA